MKFKEYNPLQINIDKKIFLKFFIIGILFLQYPELVKIIFLQKSFSAPVLILEPILKSYFILPVGIIFFITCVSILTQEIASQFLRWSLFVTYFILVGASGSSGLVNHTYDSVLLVLLFLAVLPTKEFSSNDNKIFNTSMFYSLKLGMLFYTISGYHKIVNIIGCLNEKGCLENSSFFSHHIFSNALVRKFNLPYENFLINISPTEANWIYIFLTLLEFLAFFSCFFRPSLKIVLVLLILMHLASHILMNISFVPFIYTHTVFLVFFLKDSVIKKTEIHEEAPC